MTGFTSDWNYSETVIICVFVCFFENCNDNHKRKKKEKPQRFYLFTTQWQPQPTSPKIETQKRFHYHAAIIASSHWMLKHMACSALSFVSHCSCHHVCDRDLVAMWINELIGSMFAVQLWHHGCEPGGKALHAVCFKHLYNEGLVAARISVHMNHTVFARTCLSG